MEEDEGFRKRHIRGMYVQDGSNAHLPQQPGEEGGERRVGGRRDWTRRVVTRTDRDISCPRSP